MKVRLNTLCREILAATDRVTSAPLDSVYKFSLLNSLSIEVFELEEMLVIESGKTRTRTAHKTVERNDGVGDKRNQIILALQQTEG